MADKFADSLFKKEDPRPTAEQRAVYFGSAFLVTLVPLYLFISIFDLSFSGNFVVLFVVTVFSALIMTFAYHNVAHTLKQRLQQDREASLSNAYKGGKNKADSQEDRKRALQLQLALTAKESVSFSILYNNVLFLLLVLVFGFFVMGNATPASNYVLTVTLSAASLTLFSAFSLKN
eukprot:TRINITY_DN3731_c0_g1_i1.p1 TRINITY_DN3731_c0_g1~~TRINITY_DN3731_c0_g1_i1.p1  ORF type:complete len:198 (-),score=70.09 TRINITY_DN3731_c0_g1_i1:44-571(-)